MDKDGVGIPDFSVDIILTRHIPDTLPIKGKRVKLTYPGIPNLCSKCWKLGHCHWECKDQWKSNWLELVLDFYIDDRVTDDMLGSWVDSLYLYHPYCKDIQNPAHQTSNPTQNNLRASIPPAGPQRGDIREIVGQLRDQGRFQTYQQSSGYTQDDDRCFQWDPRAYQHQPREFPNNQRFRYPRGQGNFRISSGIPGSEVSPSKSAKPLPSPKPIREFPSKHWGTPSSTISRSSTTTA